MKIYKLIFSMLLLFVFTFTSCVWKQAATHVAIKKKAFTAQVTSISTTNNQFTLTGTNLDQVTTVKLKDGSTETLFEIASQSGTQIVVNSLANITVAAGKMLDFIIADAYSAATFSVNFSLCDSTLNGKLLDCTIVVNDRDVLSYDGTSQTWKPRNVNGLNYLGVYDVSGLLLEASIPAASNGDYYVVSGVGGNLRPTIPGDGSNDIAIVSGDWLSYSDNDTWQVVKNGKNGVASFYGRIGAVVPREADYTLGQMSDVKYTVVPADRNVLTYSSADTAWIPAATLPTNTVNATSIVPGTVTGGTGGNLASATITGSAAATGVTSNIIANTIMNSEINAAAGINLSKLENLPVGFSGVAVGTQTNLAATNTVQGALEKLALIPTDYVSKNYIAALQTLAGTYSFTSDVFIADPVTAIGTEAVNINYVTAYVETFGKWTKGVGLINYMGGKVGIGSAAPNGMLDVESAAGNQVVNFIAPLDSVLNMGTSATGIDGRAELGFHNAATPYAYWNGIGAVTPPAIRLQTGGGKVAIGAIDPASLLHVYSATVATVATFQSGAATCNVSPGTAGAITCSSDIRLKENISEIPDALSKVLALRGVSFQWKERTYDDNKRSIGFIAQEVEKVTPELVVEAHNGYKQVNYSNFVAVLTQAMRELYNKHIVPLWENDKKQDQEIKRLSAENRELKNRLDKLEKMINQKK